MINLMCTQNQREVSMDRLNNLVEIVKHSNNMPALLSLFLGLIVIKKRPLLLFNESEITGDNVPATLMDGLR
jgi:hypothetical protein